MTEMINLDSIKPNPKNPRKISKEAMARLVASIKRDPKFMTLNQIKVDDDGIIVGGNQRYEACRSLGMKEVPSEWVKRTGPLTEDERQRFIAIDNSPEGISGEWDYEMLAADWELPELESVGFDLDKIQPFLDDGESGKDGDVEIGLAEELNKKWGVKAGDLWVIGDHRLICGDSTVAGEVVRLMGEERAQICWTDPPWNVAYGQTDHPSWKKREIVNDNLGDKFPEFASAFCESIKSVLLPGGLLYMAMSAQEWPTIDKALREKGFHWSSTIIWGKDTLVLSRKDYHTQYEPIWYGWLDGASRLREVTDRTQSDLWIIDRPKRSPEHPTTKPVELVERSLRNSSHTGDIVYEPFAGSGTTMVACQNLGRKCRAFEIMPNYCAVTLERVKAVAPSIKIERANA